MNILYLNNSVHLGGDTNCILKLCKEFKHNYNVKMCSSGGILLKNFEELGIQHYNIGDVDDKNPISIIKNIRELRKIIKEYDIDIIHSHHRMTTLIAKIASKFTKTKVVHTQHLCIEDKFKLTNIALSKSQIITVSNAAKNILINKSKLEPNSIKTIYNGIELENKNKEIDKKLIELREEGYFIVAQISRIIDYKGIYDFVDIAKETVENNKNIRFIFIGDGPEADKFNEYIRKNKMEQYIYLLGRKNNVIEHLKHIDVLLLCSYIEGLPLAPIEAFSQGVPVIATNIDGTNEEIINGYNGYLVDKKNITGFVSYIEKIYNDNDLRIKLSYNAKKDYSKRFTTESYIDQHNKIYIEQMSKGRIRK